MEQFKSETEPVLWELGEGLDLDTNLCVWKQPGSQGAQTQWWCPAVAKADTPGTHSLNAFSKGYKRLPSK